MPSRLINLLLLAFALLAGTAGAADVRILVQSSPLAGFRYYAGEDLWQEMREGDRPELIRAAENRRWTAAS